MLALTLTPRRSATTELIPWSGTVEELTDLLGEHALGPKDGEALIPATFNPCPAQCRNAGKPGATNCGGNRLHRLDANVATVTLLGADVDDVSDSRFAEVLASLAFVRHWWWHTHSHVPGSGTVRARILVALSAPIAISDPREWSLHYWPTLIAKLGLTDVADESCRNPARIYFLPRQDQPGGQTGFSDGEAFDVGTLGRASLPAPAPVIVPAGLPLTPAVADAVRAALDAHGPAIQGARGNQHTFRVGALLLRDWALSLEQALPLALEWNRDNQPEWSVDELRDLLEHGGAYASGPLGSRRLRVDPVGVTRALADQWRASGSEDPMPLVNQVRAIPFEDPALRSMAERELIAATGLGSRALDLPRAVRRAEPRAATADTDNPYGFDLTITGQPICNLSNALKALQHDKPKTWLDPFLQRICTPHGEWSEQDTDATAVDMQARLGLTTIPSGTVHQAVGLYAREQERDSAKELFEALRWDGTRRASEFFQRACGAADNEYTRAVSVAFLRSIAARATMPGCKVDTMPVLEGPQGIRKSTAVRELVGARWFGEATESPHSKDFPIQLQGKLLVEVPELDAFSRGDVTAVKRVLSCQVDRYRPPYGRSAADFPRRCVLIGTTNSERYLRDDTGARRFWPIACTHIDLEWIRANREQLFAEAMADLAAGATWWEIPLEAAQDEQELRRQTDPWEDLIEEYLATVKPEKLRVLDLLQGPLAAWSNMDRGDQLRVAGILRRLGWERKTGRLNGAMCKFWSPLP